MGLNNPDILFPLLEDLSQKVRDLNHHISNAIDDGERLKNVSSDQLSQAVFDTNHTANVKENDESKIRFWETEVMIMHDRTTTLISKINDTERRIRRLLQACNESIVYWDDQLLIAKRKLAEWQAYLAKAIQEMNNALAAEQYARSRYNSAASSYNQCINEKDSQGRPTNRNCSSYQYEMQAAKNAINQARQDYQHWSQEKVKAENEIKRWEARIARCTDALSKLNEAVNTGKVGLKLIYESADFAQRCLEEINAAGALVQKSKEHNNAQDLSVSINLANIRTSQTISDDSKNSFIMATTLANQVQFYGCTASEEITRKADAIKEFSLINQNL